MNNPWHDVSAETPGLALPHHFRAIIEIPKGSSNKYELDKQSGMLRLDRVLASAVYYPANYGFIPQTLGEDNDPLDVLVYSAEKIEPMCICDARAIGMMSMVDEGQPDHKIVAVLVNDPEYAEVHQASDFSQHQLKMLKRFLEDYKVAEGKRVDVEEILPMEAAHAVIEQAISDYWTERQRLAAPGVRGQR